MQIIVTGTPTKLPVELCRKAVRYYASKLLSKRNLENITVRLVFTDEGLHWREKANCIWTLGSDRFTIIIRPHFGTRLMLSCIAHEMVHIRQWVTGELVEYVYKTEYKWQGKRYTIDYDKQYWFSPWEIDAYGREIGLYRMFLTEPQYALCRK